MIKKSLIFSIMMVLLVSLFGCAGESQWNDGVYQGSAEGIHGDTVLSVEIKKGKIKEITIDSQNDTAGLTDIVYEQVPQAIIENQSTDVDTVTGATVSSEAIIAATEKALDKAKK